jgi:hypothetical protein
MDILLRCQCELIGLRSAEHFRLLEHAGNSSMQRKSREEVDTRHKVAESPQTTLAPTTLAQSTPLSSYLLSSHCSLTSRSPKLLPAWSEQVSWRLKTLHHFSP